MGLGSMKIQECVHSDISVIIVEIYFNYLFQLWHESKVTNCVLIIYLMMCKLQIL